MDGASKKEVLCWPNSHSHDLELEHAWRTREFLLASSPTVSHARDCRWWVFWWRMNGMVCVYQQEPHVIWGWSISSIFQHNSFYLPNTYLYMFYPTFISQMLPCANCEGWWNWSENAMGYIKCNGITNISAFVLIMESVQAKRLFIKKAFQFYFSVF